MGGNVTMTSTSLRLSIAAVSLLAVGAGGAARADRERPAPHGAPARGATSPPAAPKARAEAAQYPAPDDALPLTGAQPFAVNVKVDNNGIPEFSAPGSSTTYTELAWTAV